MKACPESKKACKPKIIADRMRCGEQNPRSVPNSSTSQTIKVASTGIEVIRNSISLVGLLLSANLAGAAGTLGGAYDDARLNWTVAEASGMRVDYPAGIFTVELGPPDKGPGRVLRSEDGAAGFAFYVQSNTEHDTPASFLGSRLSAPRTKISYVRVTERFVAVSGAEGGRIYYGRSGPIHCMELVYSKDEKRFWDPIVTRVSLSLR